MNCAISQEQQKRFGTQVAKDLLEAVRTGETPDPKTYMQSIYNQVKDATGDHARALDYARLAPVFMEQIAVHDQEIKTGLRSKGFSMDALADLVIKVSNEENGLKSTEEFIGVTTDIAAELGEDNANNNDPTEDVGGAPPVVISNSPEAQPPANRTIFQAVGQRVNDYIRRKFKAYAPTALADRIQEALSWRKTSPDYNVVDPEQVFYFKVKRRIVSMLAEVDYDSSQMNLDGMGPVYLTAMASSELASGDLRPGVDETSEAHQNGVVMVLTDRYGIPLKFTNEGVATIAETGKVAYYFLRQTSHLIDAQGKITLRPEDNDAVKALAEQKRITIPAAEVIYKRELQMIADMRKFVLENKQANTVQNIINGGTQGYIEFDYNLRTPLDSVQFGNQAFAPYSPTNNAPELGLKKGRTYFKVDEMYGQYVEVERPTVTEAGVGEELASLLVDNILDKNGVAIDTAEKQKIVDDYIKTGPEGVQIFEDPNDRTVTIVKLKGKALAINTPEEKAAAKEALLKFFTERGAAREISQNEIGDRRVVRTLDNAKRNTILEVGDGEAKKYYIIDDQKLHINKDKITNGNILDFKIEEDENGNKILGGESIPYKDFIKKKFFVQHPLNKQGQLVKLNAYFTFQPTQEALDTMYGTEELEAPIQEAEDNAPPPATDGPADQSTGFDDLFNEAWNDEELFKELGVKTNDLKATKEQIAAAKIWYENSPIRKHVPFEVMFHAVNTKNSQAVASWALSGITLFKGSDYSDLYHEAFHAFTQTFMTKAQRASLYNEARKKTGSFTDYQGKRVQFSRATDTQLEEYMAEDFRKYMLNGNKAKTTEPQRNSFFRKLLNMLKALFENSSIKQVAINERADNSIREIYEKLRVGNLNEYTFSQENVQFGELNKGVQAWNEDEPIKALSYENSRTLVETIDSLFSEYIDRLNAQLSDQEMLKLSELEAKVATTQITQAERREYTAQIEALKSKATYKYSSSVTTNPNELKRAYKYTKRKLAILYNAMRAKFDAEENQIKKDRLQKDLETLHYAIRNFGDVENLSNNQFADSESIKGMIGYHMHKSSKYFEDTIELDFENMTEEELFLKGLEGYDRNGNETSMKDLAKKEILYLLKGINKVGVDGKPVLNKFGVPELINFQEIWNRLARTLQNQPKADKMFEALLKESENYAPFKQLLNKLGPLGTGSAAEVSLWSNFWQTFNLTRVPLIQMTVEKTEKDGKARYQSNIGEASADYRKVGQRWQSAFHVADHKKSKYLSHDKNGNYLNLKAIIEDFQEGENTPAEKRLKGRELEFFKAIGFNFTDVPEIRAALTVTGENVRSAHWYKEQLRYLAARGDIQVRNFNDINKEYDPTTVNGRQYEKRLGMRGRFKNLQVLESRYSDQHSNYMVTTADNNTQFEHSLNNTLTIMVNTINNSTSYADLISNPHMAHLDVNRNPFAKASTWINSLYDLSQPGGPRRRVSDDPSSEFVELKLTNLSGVRLTEEGNEMGDGIASAKADEFTKLIMDFHMVTQAGIPELMRHADKGTSFSVALTKIYTDAGVKNQYLDNTDFLAPASSYHAQALKIIMPQIMAELERIIIMRDMAASGVENFDFKYLAQGQNFVAFDDVLSAQTKAGLIWSATEGLTNEEILSADVYQMIFNDTQKYFNGLVAKAEARIGKSEFIADSLYTDTIDAARKKGRANTTRSEVKQALIQSFVYNSWIHNLESVSILYGDLAQYNHEKEEFHKRNAGAGSTGRIYRTDQSMQEYINTTAGRKYAESLGLAPKTFNGTMDTAIVQDNNIGSSYYKQYLEAIGDEKAAEAYNKGRMNEGDAQGAIAFDSYRILKIAEGSWGSAQEKLYKDIVDGKEVRAKDVHTFFPVIKAQYFGALQTEGLPVTAFHKFSLFPMIPSVIKGTNLQKIHDKMVREGIDYLTFESGSKVGTITKNGTPDKLYQGSRKNISDEPYTKNTIFLEYLKNQLEIAPKFKDQVVFSTQMRKLIEDGLMENGVPTDFMEGSSAEERTQAWEAMTEASKLRESPRYKLLKKYEDNIRKLTEIKKKELLRKLNWTMEVVDGQEILNGDIEDLMKFVKKELSRQDLADHEIDFIEINADGTLKHDLSKSLSAEKIEKLLNSLITKRLVKQKVNGENLIQVSGAMFESFASTEDRDYDNPTDEELEKWGTNDLPSYRVGADGRTKAMKVKIALQGQFMNLLKAKHKDGSPMRTIQRLNESIRDEEWLNKGRNREMITMVGVRIPVQGLNSMEFMEVYEFLPAEAGNIIVPPAEIVAKSGADFDIDKMSVMMPNINKNGSVTNYTEQEIGEKYEKYKQGILDKQGLDDEQTNNLIEAIFGESMDDIESEIVEMLIEEGGLKTYEDFKETLVGSKAIENELISNIKEILSLPENYATLIRPNGTDIVKPIADDLQEFVQDYDPTAVVNGEVRRNKDDSKDVISPTRVFEIDYNLYKHSSNNIGKQTLGLGAVDNTYNSVFNRIGFRMNATKGISTAKYESLKAKTSPTKQEKKLMKEYRRQTLLLPHNTIDVNGEAAISLSSIMSKDVAGEPQHRISDVINQLINGWVDIAKDTWIFNIQGNKEVAPALMFMIQAGVPVKDAIYFASQPMVRDYVKEQRLAKSTFAEPLAKAPENPMYFRNKAREEILLNPKYGYDLSASQVRGSAMNGTIKAIAEEKVNTPFETKELYDTIKNYSIAAKAGEQYEFNDKDRAAFIHFLEVEDMSKAVRDIKLKMNFDTSRSGTLFDAQNRILMKEALKYDERIPSKVVDDIINNSPIGSFYIQPFQLAIWKDVFTLRNHDVINGFLLEKFQSGIMNDVRNTFGDNERFANEFRNDLMSFIFQNALKEFDAKTSAYRGSKVQTEIPVAQVTSLKFGAFVKDGIMYVDNRQIDREFKTKEFTRASYAEKGLAKVSSMAFANAAEYKNFVYEREHLRDALPYNKIKDTAEYIEKRNIVGALAQQKTTENQEQFNKRLDKEAYENFLRDSALDNIFNHWKLFKSSDTYADQFNLLRTSFPELGEDYALINQLSVGTSKTGFSNLKLNDTFLDGDTLNLFHENLIQLMDPTVKKVDDPVANDRISDFFGKLPTVAFLQSGMTTKSAFSLTRIVPQDSFLSIMEKPVNDLLDHLQEAKDANKTPPILDEFYEMFVNNNGVQNRATRIRGKSYLTDMSIAGSKRMMADDKVTRTDVGEKLNIGDPLQTLGSGLKGFNPVDITAANAKQIAIDNPNNTYVYNFALDNQNNATVQDRNFFGVEQPNVIGLPTRLKYAGGATQENMKDLNGQIDPRVKAEIDAAVDSIKEQQAAGQQLVFNRNGYGQYMIGASDTALTKGERAAAQAPQTFLYLSKRLLEEFGYINPNYLATKTGKTEVQSSQPITDAMVEDFMNHCI